MRRGVMWTGALVAGAAGAAYVWRHQAEILTSRPVSEWTFTHMSALLPTEVVPRSTVPRPLPRQPRDLSVTYRFGGAEHTLADLHRRTFTTGFAVLHRGALVHECYPGRFGSPRARFQLFSLTKSVTSILVGIAVEEGALALDEPAVAYRPELAGSAYDGATVEHLLQMSSGAGFTEDYAAPDSAIARFERAVTNNGSLLDVALSVPRAAAPGELFNYSTMDSQVLGWVLEAATGMSLAAYAADRLWEPIGAEQDAYHFLTRRRPRVALGGGSFNATVRDMARVGLLMARGGEVDGRQVVPKKWVDRSRDSGLDHLRLGALGADYPPYYGYANQWWTLGGGAFTGLGIHGQLLWVDPDADVVVVKTSAWPTADDPDRDAETVAAVTALVRHLRRDG
ncbi:6-aminohexanoate-dimer hydrolase [Actinoplanes ianthinogenes]|uniref:6-aminohexanoate-dimer hydrolase n=1 Tax=Actinoplanes ianthinogenes TaxID=122358 RepID=A0ABM7M3Q8_9ACTN|nr:serine hydrolase [Actinoplanes ianthinogenes]BCJ46232.1 6-aminohexanoate-dimer hydrolase [Actinoplanes ianthinogenes]GGR27223.1 6-aminohexanoate-dimer hydrolase [Actinoplanes ianthinogenes]